MSDLKTCGDYYLEAASHWTGSKEECAAFGASFVTGQAEKVCLCACLTYPKIVDVAVGVLLDDQPQWSLDEVRVAIRILEMDKPGGYGLEWARQWGPGHLVSAGRCSSSSAELNGSSQSGHFCAFPGSVWRKTSAEFVD